VRVASPPTSTLGEESQVRIKAETTDGMMERIAASEGELDALDMIVKARIAAAGAGELRAMTNESSEARVKACVKLMGAMSFSVRETIGVGSCRVVRRICES
jgi:hypothetical protein